MSYGLFRAILKSPCFHINIQPKKKNQIQSVKLRHTSHSNTSNPMPQLRLIKLRRVFMLKQKRCIFEEEKFCLASRLALRRTSVSILKTMSMTIDNLAYYSIRLQYWPKILFWNFFGEPLLGCAEAEFIFQILLCVLEKIWMAKWGCWYWKEKLSFQYLLCQLKHLLPVQIV